MPVSRNPSYERLYDVEGYKERVLLKIFDPEPRENGWSWVCDYWLEAPHLGWNGKLGWAPGDDKLDAFASALVKITIELRVLSRRSGTFLSFMGDKNIDLIDRDFY